MMHICIFILNVNDLMKTMDIWIKWSYFVYCVHHEPRIINNWNLPCHICHSGRKWVQFVHFSEEYVADNPLIVLEYECKAYGYKAIKIYRMEKITWHGFTADKLKVFLYMPDT